ncbi:MAG: hypothetical protein A2176_11680 [Spirochaetes bacterium RBG_13_51_14]|nr:MAG: hypothetical protein A2176_11680 [Spirochaetes bacterium RBG_13_51_14]
MKIIPVKLLRLSLGFFFLILGVIGVIPRLQESIFTLNDNLGLEIIFGVVELVCGLVLVAGLFTFIRKKAISIASLVVLVFWTVRIILSKFVWGLSIGNSGVIFHPVFSTWLLVLSAELIIAAALFIMYRAYE